MRFTTAVTRAGLLAAAVLLAPAPAGAAPLYTAQAQVYFSPRGGCRAAVIEQIERSRWSIHVQAYVLTDWPIARALVNARLLRGVEVTILCDDGNETDPNSLLPWILLQFAGVVVWEDKHSGIAHNKVMIFDEAVVATGSYNWSAAAEEDNAENLLLLSGRELVDRYRADWAKHLTHARPYVPRQPKGPRLQ